MNCVFCDIIAGKAPAYVVYRAAQVIAFLDRYPLQSGHTLVVPTDHYVDLLETPDNVLFELIKLVKRVAEAQIRALGAKGVRVVQNNGSAAGQEILHVHFHVIPFYGQPLGKRRELNSFEGEKLTQILSRAIVGVE